MKNENGISSSAAFTYFGLAEYSGTQSLYDGCGDPKKEGSVEEVVTYLQSIRDLEAKSEKEPIKWRGHNGEWYQGAEAVKALDAEIESLRDGSHFSLNY